MTGRCVQAVAACSLLIGVVGCSQQGNEIRAVREQVDSLKVTLDTVEAMTTNTPSPVNYQLADVTRNSKVVGVIRSDIPIMKGDRVFLGDDIWDVDFVKVFTLPTSKVGDIQWYRSGTVELLVTFGGKAADRANSAK